MKRPLLYLLFLSIFTPVHAQYMQTINCDNGLSNRRVFQIVKDESHFMWFATRAGFDRYDGKHIRHYTLPQPKDSRIFGLATSSDGAIWGFSSHGNLYRYDKYHDRYELQLSLDSLLQTDEPFIFTIHADTRNAVWICSAQGLYRYFPQEKRLAAVTDSEGKPVYEINELEAGRYALFAEDGCYLLSTADNSPQVDLQRIPDRDAAISQVRTSYYDASEQALWLGNFTGELCVYQLGTQQFVPVSLGCNHYAIRSITADDRDNIVVGTDGGGIIFIDKHTRRVTATMTESEERSNNLISKNVYDIFCDGDGKLWIGTYNSGICVYNPHTFGVTMTQHEKTNPNSLAHSYVNALLEDRDGDMWYANNKGVSVFMASRRRWKHFFTQDNSIMSLCEDRSGNVWGAGFSAGMYAFDKRTGSMRHFTVTSTGKRLATNDITA
ncbi:MAG: hypothetical protein K2H42_02425, partial [Alistipes sp.]|nr:hypothetical protein [Alistipes sp.]